MIMEQGMIPSPSFGMADYPRPASVPVITCPGHAQCIHIVLHPDVVDETVAKLEQWFAGRDEVQIVDYGSSDKQHLGFVIMEWLECDIEQLFLAILHNEESVGDYTLYGRPLMEG